MSGSATDGQRNRDDRTSEDVQSHDPLCDYSHNPSITCGCAVIRTHDPLCGYRLHHSEESPECDMCRCDCDLIAKVRADEREQAAQRVSETFWPTGSWVSEETTFDSMGRAAVAAARGEA